MKNITPRTIATFDTPIRNSMSLATAGFLIPLLLACFGLLPRAQAVVPAPDGGYPGWNTAEGTDALLNLTTGVYNTALGGQALYSNIGGSGNTAVGLNALYHNTTGGANTADGRSALWSNTTGNYNTATGYAALLYNTNGGSNTANGFGALSGNTTGSYNTGYGVQALYHNTTGRDNTAIGLQALNHNTNGGVNTANGFAALQSNTTGSYNTADGFRALSSNTTGIHNTANGVDALLNNTTGDLNVALGFSAGVDLTTGSGNVCIGAYTFGLPGESNTTRIRNVYTSQASLRAIYVNNDNKIGTLASSRRYKENINSMDKASEALYQLKPVTFRYRKEVDRACALSFGLIAEEVAEVSPDLITRDRDGKPETVRYDAVNVMLLNEFLKEHGKNKEQEAIIAELRNEVKDLAAKLKEQAAQIQKVSVQLAAASPSCGELEVSKFATGRIRRGGPAPRTVVNNH